MLIYQPAYFHSIKNNPDFSVDTLKTYRNIITHGAYFRKLAQLNQQFNFKKGKGLNVKTLPLPDNPKQRNPALWTYNKNIYLLDFCQEIYDMIKEINKQTAKNQTNIYSF